MLRRGPLPEKTEIGKGKKDSLEIAPCRSAKDFIMDPDRYDMKNFFDDNLFILNLMYYQTNYFLFAFTIFFLQARPTELINGLILMAVPFLILNILEKEYESMGEMKQKYAGIVFSVCFSLGYLMIHQLGYEAVFFNGVMIPAAFITLHASIRSRKNTKIPPFTNSSLIYTKDWRHALGFKHQTPMGYILEGFGSSVSFLGLGVHNFQDWSINSIKAAGCLVQ